MICVARPCVQPRCSMWVSFTLVFSDLSVNMDVARLSQLSKEERRELFLYLTKFFFGETLYSDSIPIHVCVVYVVVQIWCLNFKILIFLTNLFFGTLIELSKICIIQGINYLNHGWNVFLLRVNFLNLCLIFRQRLNALEEVQLISLDIWFWTLDNGFKFNYTWHSRWIFKADNKFLPFYHCQQPTCPQLCLTST